MYPLAPDQLRDYDGKRAGFSYAIVEYFKSGVIE
jgi:hypothetical protein